MIELASGELSVIVSYMKETISDVKRKRAEYQRWRRNQIKQGLPTRGEFKRPPAVRKFFREYMAAYRARQAVTA